MSGDFSRITFDPKNKFSKGNYQQGKPITDFELNESSDIFNYNQRTALTDVIGQSGYHIHNGGFEISNSTSGSTYKISKGFIYSDGIRFENDSDIEDAITEQPDLPPPSKEDGISPAQPDAPGAFIAYFDGWERHVNYIDFPHIREIALNGVETSTRNRLVAQVKLHRLDGLSAGGSISVKTLLRRILIRADGDRQFDYYMDHMTSKQRDPQGGQQISFEPEKEEIHITHDDTLGKTRLDFGSIIVNDQDVKKSGRSNITVNITIGEETPISITVGMSKDKSSLPIILKRRNSKIQTLDWIVTIAGIKVTQFSLNPDSEQITITATYTYSHIDTTLSCDSVSDDWDEITRQPNGLMTARTKQEMQTSSHCMMPQGGGYRRWGNQLYRVEVHRGGNIGKDLQKNGKAERATIKFSRDNASKLCKVDKIINENNKLIVSGTGGVVPQGLDDGQHCFEIIDDRTEFNQIPGTLFQGTITNGNELDIIPGTVKGKSVSEDHYQSKFHPKIIRWDSPGDIPIPDPPQDKDASATWIELEDGIEVMFTLDETKSSLNETKKPANFRSKNFWVFPARILNADIEWPRDQNNNPLPKRPDGVLHHYAQLAILSMNYTGPDKNMKIEVKMDCRKPFRPLTEIDSGGSQQIQKDVVISQAHGNHVWLGGKQADLSSSAQFDFIKEEAGTRYIRRAPIQGERQNPVKFHIPFSNLVSSKGTHHQLTGVYLLYDLHKVGLDPGARITNAGIVRLAIYNGLNQRWNTVFDPPLFGNHLSLLGSNLWQIEGGESIDIKNGLGLTVEAIFSEIDQYIFINAAGIFLKNIDR